MVAAELCQVACVKILLNHRVDLSFVSTVRTRVFHRARATFKSSFRTHAAYVRTCLNVILNIDHLLELLIVFA